MSYLHLKRTLILALISTAISLNYANAAGPASLRGGSTLSSQTSTIADYPRQSDVADIAAFYNDLYNRLHALGLSDQQISDLLLESVAAAGSGPSSSGCNWWCKLKQKAKNALKLISEIVDEACNGAWDNDVMGPGIGPGSNMGWCPADSTLY